MHTDRLGRRRQTGQERGLRPLYPRLPGRSVSRALRLAMDERAWARLDALADRAARVAPTRARAYGDVIARMIDYASEPAEVSPVAWQDWERRKTLRLLLLAN